MRFSTGALCSILTLTLVIVNVHGKDASIFGLEVTLDQVKTVLQGAHSLLPEGMIKEYAIKLEKAIDTTKPMTWNDQVKSVSSVQFLLSLQLYYKIYARVIFIQEIRDKIPQTRKEIVEIENKLKSIRNLAGDIEKFLAKLAKQSSLSPSENQYLQFRSLVDEMKSKIGELQGDIQRVLLALKYDIALTEKQTSDTKDAIFFHAMFAFQNIYTIVTNPWSGLISVFHSASAVGNVVGAAWGVKDISELNKLWTVLNSQLSQVNIKDAEAKKYSKMADEFQSRMRELINQTN